MEAGVVHGLALGLDANWLREQRTGRLDICSVSSVLITALRIRAEASRSFWMLRSCLDQRP